MTPAAALEEIQNAIKCDALRIHPHAYLRCGERSVQVVDIHSACMNATGITLQPNGRFLLVGPDFDGEPLTVIVEVDEWLVITVY